jgi:hypothetical protein
MSPEVRVGGPAVKTPHQTSQTPHGGAGSQQEVIKWVKPKCPYYQDSPANLYCPYYMMSTQYHPTGMYAQHRGSNWPGMVSLVLGIIAIVLSWLSIVPFFFIIFIGTIILSVLAIIFGSIGLRNTRMGMKGSGPAIAGIVLGLLATVISVLFFMLGLMMFTYY